MISRIVQLIFILVLTSIADRSWSYSYDEALNFSDNQIIQLEAEKQRYDGTSNTISFREQRASNFHEKTQDGSFFAFEVGFVATKGGPKVGGGADLKNLSPGQQKRIQNAADKSGADVTVVGSQTTGIKPGSDFDFVLSGGTSRSRSRIRNSLPQGPRGTGDGSGRDFHKGPVDKDLPHITFTPKPKG